MREMPVDCLNDPVEEYPPDLAQLAKEHRQAAPPEEGSGAETTLLGFVQQLSQFHPPELPRDDDDDDDKEEEEEMVVVPACAACADAVVSIPEVPTLLPSWQREMALDVPELSVDDLMNDSA